MYRLRWSKASAVIAGMFGNASSWFRIACGFMASKTAFNSG